MSVERMGAPGVEMSPEATLAAVQLPANIEAERCALGGMLLSTPESNDAIDRSRSLLHPCHFHDARHRPIYAAMLALRDRGQYVTIVTVAEGLKGQGNVEQAGGNAYLAGLLDEGALAYTVDGYVRIIVDKAFYREMIMSALHIADQAKEGSLPPSELLMATQRRFDDIGEAFQQTQGSSLKLIRPSELPSDPVEFIIDSILPKGMSVLLSGKDKLGKTLLALEMIRSVLKGRPLLDHFESVRGPVIALLLDDPASLTRSRMSDLGIADDESVTVCDPAKSDVGRSDFFAHLEREAQRISPALIVIDALYLFLPRTADAMNDAARMGPIMNQFNRLAEKTGACVLVITHDAKSGLDVAGSLAIRAAAKVIMRLARPDGGSGEDVGNSSRDPRRVLSVESKMFSRTAWALELHGPGKWTFVGNAGEFRAHDLRRDVLGYLNSGHTGTVEEIARFIGGRSSQVRDILIALKQEGLAHEFLEAPAGGKGGRRRQVWRGGSFRPV